MLCVGHKFGWYASLRISLGVLRIVISSKIKHKKYFRSKPIVGQTVHKQVANKQKLLLTKVVSNFLQWERRN